MTIGAALEGTLGKSLNNKIDDYVHDFRTIVFENDKQNKFHNYQ